MIEKIEKKLEIEIEKICNKGNLTIEEIKTLSEIKTALSFADSLLENNKSQNDMSFLSNCCCEETKRKE